MEEKIFINRQDELDALTSALKRKGAELIILYGRRRVGKSRLLKEAGKKINIDVFVMLEEADYSTNLNKVSAAAAKRFAFPSFSPSSFKEFFEAVPNDVIIALDEYSYIAGSSGEFQAIWEEIAKPKGIKIILSGSLIRTMEDLNYSLKSPLYGRATKIMKLMPLSLAHVREWYAKANLEDILKTYFCVGGIPRYLEIIDSPSIDGILNAFFSRDGLLLREGKLLLKESFPASVLIPKILFSIADGASEASKIANNVHIKASEIGKYLALLSEYGFVEKRYPLLGGGKKDVRFYSADRFLSLWTRFVWPYYSDIENGFAGQAINDFKKSFNTYCGLEFEKATIELIHLFPEIVPFRFDKLGRQWGKIPRSLMANPEKNQYEIDIVALNEKTKEILFAECKWQDKADAKKIMAELKEKTEFVKWNNDKRKKYYAIFAKSFKEKIKEPNLFLFDLKDVQKTLLFDTHKNL